MSFSLPPQIRLRGAAMSLITLLGGVSLAVIPAATVAISARQFTLDEQGFIAVAVMLATFVGQVTFAVVVESRLSSAATARRVTFPLWLAALSVLTAIIVGFNSSNALVLCVSLPILLASLEVGRGVSVAERLDTREIWASVLVGSGALAGVLVAFTAQTWGMLPLVAGIAAATCVRSLPVSHQPSRPDPVVMGWVVADTSITGVIYPLLNVMILAFIGPAQAIIFTAISTVSGLLAIPLNFLRLRLLKEPSRLDIGVSGLALLGAIVALGILEATGTFGFIFGSAWSLSDTALPLAVACAWRATSILTTIPFAALRRMGAVRLLTGLRAIVAAITFALAGLGLVTQNIVWVFAGMLVAELISAVIYEGARRSRTTSVIKD
ncbi:hypothetical protein [Cryobacterium sp. Hb1]|uniref:hypothetical protein n=1 Tax=Cryobacterium sp. Hb1 TaxID=1259147 RepID=UPI00106B9AF9|nr:hypothetical protein [Cryobacterium sp. Hb1]TFD70117.1 hypothetical protein E3T38_06735 [Cryobacterium sp. Hb1]